VGTQVTITGTNFGSSGTVTFNNTTAATTSWSATSIATSVPSGATTGSVVVTVGGLTSNGVNFTVGAPAPNITNLNPNSGPVGTPVTITGTNFGSSGTVTFNNTTAATTSWSSTSISTSVPNGATTGSVVVTTGGVASTGVNFTVGSAQTSITLVQHTNKDAGITTSSSLAFPAANTAGNWIGVAIRAGRANQVFTITDSRGNTYRKAVQFNVTFDAPNGDTTAIYYAENISGGANTVTVFDTISGTLRFAIFEYSGVAAANSLDGTAASQGNGASVNSGNAATTGNGDLLFAAIMTANAGGFTAGTGYTIEERVPTAPNTKLIAEDQTQAAAGTASASATLAASDVWGALLAAFQPAIGNGCGVSISPHVTVLTFTRTQQFVSCSANVTWSVDGVVGGSAPSGTITSAGLYTPPAAVGTHTVTVSSSSGPANATVYVSNYPGTFMHHNDNSRTGQNLSETVLTPANVNSAQFGKLFTYTTDGDSHASPLYVANVNIPGQGFHNVVYVATEHDTLYAFDADGLSNIPLWSVSFINPAAGITTVPLSDTGAGNGEIGIRGTPVIDQGSGTIYLVAKTKEVVGGTTNYVQRLHALSIATGLEKSGSPVVLQGNVPGAGSGSSNGMLAFDPLRQMQRPALLLSNGVVYIGFASHDETSQYHGWILAYGATTLQQVMAFCASPNDVGAGIWMSGGGLASDSAGNIYFSTGNGGFDANTGGKDYGDSFVQLSPSGNVLDYFTPFDQSGMAAGDGDLGSGGVLLLPDQPGANPRLVGSAGKTGTIYLVSRDSMGHFNTNNNNQIVQSLPGIFTKGGSTDNYLSTPVYFNGFVYFGPQSDAIQAFHMSNGLLSTAPSSASPEVFPYPGATLTISASGSANGILWAEERSGPITPGALHAYDASNLAIELYSSNLAGSRDTLDVATTFNTPLVANGKVFVGSVSQLTVYGLLP
jgi:hypothetical protein